jgi:hypothetical protein
MCRSWDTLRENYSEKAQSGKRYFKITPQSPSTGGTWSSSPVSKTGPANFKPEVEDEIVQSLHTQLSLGLGSVR